MLEKISAIYGMGNQGAYDVWGKLSMTVAAICIPVGQSVNGMAAGTSQSVIMKTAVKEIAIDKSADLLSDNTSIYLSNKLNLNEKNAMFLNMGINMSFNMGMNKGIDTIKSSYPGKVPFTKGISQDAKINNDPFKKIEPGNKAGNFGLNDLDVKVNEGVNKGVL